MTSLDLISLILLNIIYSLNIIIIIVITQENTD